MDNESCVSSNEYMKSIMGAQVSIDLPHNQSIFNPQKNSDSKISSVKEVDEYYSEYTTERYLQYIN